MRILLVYPGHKFSTVDVACGYEKALRALGHDVKAFNYHNAIAFYAAALALWGEQNPDLRRGLDDVSIMASEHVVIDAVDFVPDVVLIVCGHALHRRAYDLIHRLRLPIALLLTESPYNDELQAKIIEKGHIAMAFANDKGSVPLLSKEGKKVVYLPHSYDAEIHRSRQASASFKTDVFFQGTLFPERRELFSPLQNSSYNVYIGGPDPDMPVEDEDDFEEMMSQIMDNREMAFYYAATKIAVNHHRTLNGKQQSVNGKAYSIGPRAYEIAACGAFQLCDDTRPELRDVFGESVATYHDGGDLAEKIDYYLTHEDERQMMAHDAYMRVQDCTFERRASDILIPALMEVI